MFNMGRTIKAFRQKVAPNMTAADFAEEVGISASDLSKLETNRMSLKVTHVALITLAFGDRELYYKFRQMEDEYIFKCCEKKQLVSF